MSVSGGHFWSDVSPFVLFWALGDCAHFVAPRSYRFCSVILRGYLVVVNSPWGPNEQILSHHAYLPGQNTPLVVPWTEF